jgi:hypothetical protein
MVEDRRVGLAHTDDRRVDDGLDPCRRPVTDLADPERAQLVGDGAVRVRDHGDADPAAGEMADDPPCPRADDLPRGSGRRDLDE